MDDLNILFSSLGTGFKETIKPLRSLEIDDSKPTLMPDGKLLQPIKVFSEGEYASITRSGKPVKLVVTKERMEKWLSNTRRDVPFNEDHNRVAGPNNFGWLRVRTGSAYVAMDPEDGKWALYAQPELTESLYSMVKNGRYRDVSLEIDTTDDLLVGIAVTNYPRVKTLTQMSELAAEHDPKAMPANVNEQVVNLLFDNTNFVNKLEAIFSKTVIKNKPEENLMDLETMKAEFEAKLAEMQLQVESVNKSKDEELAAVKAQAEAVQAELLKIQKEKELAEWQAKRAKTILGFSEKVSNLVLNDKGESMIPAGIQDDVVELFAFLADRNEELLFSELEEEKQVNPVDLFERILTGVAKFNDIMHKTPTTNGAADIEVDEPATDYGDTLRALFRKKSGK